VAESITRGRDEKNKEHIKKRGVVGGKKEVKNKNHGSRVKNKNTSTRKGRKGKSASFSLFLEAKKRKGEGGNQGLPGDKWKKKFLVSGGGRAWRKKRS